MDETGIIKILEKNFFTKGKNYKRSGMNVNDSIKASNAAFKTAIKLGADRSSLEKSFKKGFTMEED